MARRFVWQDSKWVPIEDARRRGSAGLTIIHDIKEYRSPLGTGLISSRRERREDLKRHNCREVDPSEFKPTYKNERFARKHGLPFGER